MPLICTAYRAPSPGRWAGDGPYLKFRSSLATTWHDMARWDGLTARPQRIGYGSSDRSVVCKRYRWDRGVHPLQLRRAVQNRSRRGVGRWFGGCSGWLGGLWRAELVHAAEQRLGSSFQLCEAVPRSSHSRERTWVRTGKPTSRCAFLVLVWVCEFLSWLASALLGALGAHSCRAAAACECLRMPSDSTPKLTRRDLWPLPARVDAGTNGTSGSDW